MFSNLKYFFNFYIPALCWLKDKYPINNWIPLY